MALRWFAGICLLALVGLLGYVLQRSTIGSSADLGIAARLGYERVEELRRSTSPEYRQAERQLARAQRVLERGGGPYVGLPKLSAAYDRMLELSYAGRWVEAAKVATENPRLGYSDLLDAALNRGAPIQVVVDLVELNGGTLPDDAITTIAFHSLNLVGWSGAAELAGTLVQTHGLDVHFVDDDGQNALTIAAGHFYELPEWKVNHDALELVEFLLAHSVTTKPNAGGLDALDRILLKILDAPAQTVGAGTVFLRHLIDRGAPVELSHVEVAQMIAVSDAEAHTRLIEAAPELLP